MAKTTSTENQKKDTTAAKTEVSRIINLDMPQRILSKLEESHCPTLPTRISRSVTHAAGVNCVEWSPPYGQLLASGSLDQTVKIWNVINAEECLATIDHTGGVKALQWSSDSHQLASGGLDQQLLVTDVETTSTIHRLKHPSTLSALKYHPSEPSLLLASYHKSTILCWDLRTESVVHTYRPPSGDVLDVEFIAGDDVTFASSQTVSTQGSMDNSVMIWDFRTAAPLSHQVYTEAYSCTCIRMHPGGSCFVAQTHGDYVAIFDSFKPWKLHRHKRFEGHQSAGYNIKCRFNYDGSKLFSGSVDGSIHVYNFYSSKTDTMKAKTYHRVHREPCTDVAMHPVLDIMVSCGWDGVINIFER
eukprot:GILK01011869.1.p1 GENE.GILK01011869.1~~GILK01011869.1.p1  ORF type:complete len:389 (-),score=45.07 GILK01011869.1:326-1399(-)